MADADIVITSLLENLSRLQLANLFLGMEDEVRSLQNELTDTQTYLRSLRQKLNEQSQSQSQSQYQSLMVKFINQISDAAREAEDVVDVYVASVAGQRMLRNKVRLFFSTHKIVVARRRIAAEIKSIRKRFEEIVKDGERLGIQLTSQQGGMLGDETMEDDLSLRKGRLMVEETDVVGFDTDARMIMNQLINGDVQRGVVSIVGMAGIGKTTLARKVYTNPAVANCFDFRAWVYVSKGYRVRDLLQAIFKCARGLTAEEMKEMSDEELGFELRKYLRSTRYLIVFDDVRSTELWDVLNQVFANNMNGSRIIFTTRNMEVALHVNPSSHTHELRFLGKDESWELFSRKVFWNESCPLELEDLGKEMADKCRGLPLAIVVLAGVLMRKEKSTRLWSKVSSSVSSILTEHTYPILELSYIDLPHHLKPCFLYFALFPKDFEIPAKQLVRLWIAEGFVQKNDQAVMEEVGENYLEDLIARNLIQVSNRRFDGTIKTCYIHGLLLDLCINKAKEEKFVEVLGYGCSSLVSNSRRLGFHSNMLESVTANPSASKVRSILCFGKDERQLSLEEWKILYRGFPLLRVLDPWSFGVELIPKQIDKLTHLRYLRLKSLTAQNLPASVSNLWNLQTLEVTAPCIDRAQIDIWKMKELRYLSFNGQAVLPEPPKGKVRDSSNVLSNLLTVSCVSPDSCTESAFSMLPNLLKLGIHGDLEKHRNLTLKNLATLNCLQTLKLKGDRRCTELTSLRYVKFPPNLTKLTLLETRLLEDPMDVLGQLPNLQVLKLKNAAYSGRNLSCSSKGFPKLQVLKLVDLAIRSWTISEGAMLSLRSVVISCGNLDSLPSALASLPAFQELELWSPHVSLVEESKEIEMTRGKEQFKLVVYQS